jgi:hypothetical protein
MECGMAQHKGYFRPLAVRRSVIFGIFLLALLSRLAILFWTKSYLAPERTEVVRIAVALVREGSFADAYGDNTGLTAHTSPAYPLLLSLVFRVFGTGLKGEIAQEVLSSVLASLDWAIIPIAVVVSGLSVRTGALAGFAGALLPLNRWSETKGSFESALAALALICMFTYVMYSWRERKFSLVSAAITGGLTGLAILISASLAIVAVALLVCGYFFFRNEESEPYLRFVAATLAVAMGVLFPWALRNYFALGGFVWTRSNFGLELQVSNNDLAQPNFDDNQEAMSAYHPHENAAERAKVRSVGELAYQRQKKNNAFHWINSHPGAFSRLTLKRMFYFWFPKMKRPQQSLLLALVTLGSITGWISLRAQVPKLAYALLALLFAYPLVYYCVQAQPRYVYPIEWTLFVLSAYAIATMRGWEMQAHPSQESAASKQLPERPM